MSGLISNIFNNIVQLEKRRNNINNQCHNRQGLTSKIKASKNHIMLQKKLIKSKNQLNIMLGYSISNDYILNKYLHSSISKTDSKLLNERGQNFKF